MEAVNGTYLNTVSEFAFYTAIRNYIGHYLTLLIHSLNMSMCIVASILIFAAKFSSLSLFSKLLKIRVIA